MGVLTYYLQFIFAENCMKMKEFGSRGYVPGAPLDPPMTKLTHHFNTSHFHCLWGIVIWLYRFASISGEILGLQDERLMIAYFIQGSRFHFRANMGFDNTAIYSPGAGLGRWQRHLVEWFLPTDSFHRSSVLEWENRCWCIQQTVASKMHQDPFAFPVVEKTTWKAPQFENHSDNKKS